MPRALRLSLTLRAPILGAEFILALLPTDVSPPSASDMPKSRQFISLEQAEAPFYAGVDLGGTNIKVGVVDNAGRPLSWTSIETHADRGADSAVARMAEALKTAVSQAKLQPRDIRRVGLGSPGTMDIPAGLLLEPPNLPGWNHYPIRERLSQCCGLPVTFANDAGAAAYGEFWVGCGKEMPSMVLLTLGHRHRLRDYRPRPVDRRRAQPRRRMRAHYYRLSRRRPALPLRPAGTSRGLRQRAIGRQADPRGAGRGPRQFAGGESRRRDRVDAFAAGSGGRSGRRAVAGNRPGNGPLPGRGRRHADAHDRPQRSRAGRRHEFRRQPDRTGPAVSGTRQSRKCSAERFPSWPNAPRSTTPRWAETPGSSAPPESPVWKTASYRRAEAATIDRARHGFTPRLRRLCPSRKLTANISAISPSSRTSTTARALWPTG